MKMGRRATIAFLLLAPIFLLGARCIDHESLRKGPDGDWHLYGEIHNDTNVQGTQILLQGTLFDPSGRVVGVGQTYICPGDLSPGTFSVYDIRIKDSSAIVGPVARQVNVLSGKAVPEHLPPLPVTDINFTTTATRAADGSVSWEIDFHYSPPTDGPVSSGPVYGCAAFYDASGNVVSVERPDTPDVGQYHISGFSELKRDMDPTVPADAVSFRGLFWFPSSDSAQFESNFAPVISDLIAIPAEP